MSDCFFFRLRAIIRLLVTSRYYKWVVLIDCITVLWPETVGWQCGSNRDTPCLSDSCTVKKERIAFLRGQLKQKLPFVLEDKNFISYHKTVLWVGQSFNQLRTRKGKRRNYTCSLYFSCICFAAPCERICNSST